MKSKTSLFNAAIFKRDVRGNVALWAAVAVLYFIHIPLAFFETLSNPYNIYNVSSADRFNDIMDILQALSIEAPVYGIMAALIAAALFSYLYVSKHSNMIHTFPVSRKSLFFTHYVSGLAFMWVPMVANMLLGYLVCMAYQVNMGWWPVKTLLIMFAESFFYFNVVLCVIMFVGNVISALVLYGILNFLYYGCYCILQVILNTVCYGIGNGIYWDFNMFTPMVYMTEHIGIKHDIAGYSVEGVTACWIYVATAVVCGVIAYITYQKKQLETAGDVITVGWFKPIFRWGVTVCGAVCLIMLTVAMFFYTDAGAPVPVILLMAVVYGLIVFFLAQMILDRTIRVFQKKRVIEGLICVTCLCATYLALDWDVFGVEKYMPKAEAVKYMTINGASVVYADELEEIEKLMEIHKKMITSKKEFEQYAAQMGSYTMSIEVDYRLDNNRIVHRRYSVPAGEQNWENPESVLGKVAVMTNEPEQIMYRTLGVHYEENKVLGGMIYRGWSEKQGHTESIRLSAEQAQGIYEGYKKDIEIGIYDEDFSWYYKEVYTEEAEDYNYYDSIELDMSNPKGHVEVWDYALWHGIYGYDNVYPEMERNNVNSFSIHVPLRAGSINTIQALIEAGVIENVDELTMYTEE